MPNPLTLDLRPGLPPDGAEGSYYLYFFGIDITDAVIWSHGKWIGLIDCYKSNHDPILIFHAPVPSFSEITAALAHAPAIADAKGGGNG